MKKKNLPNAFSHRNVLPFIFVLMSRKCKEAYEAVFNYIDTHIIKIKGAASFTTDYELAMRKALKIFSPSSAFYACYFHFCQAVKRNAFQTDGFVKFMRNIKEQNLFTTDYCVCHCFQANTLKNVLSNSKTKPMESVNWHSIHS